MIESSRRVKYDNDTKKHYLSGKERTQTPSKGARQKRVRETADSRSLRAQKQLKKALVGTDSRS